MDFIMQYDDYFEDEDEDDEPEQDIMFDADFEDREDDSEDEDHFQPPITVDECEKTSKQ